MASVRDIRRRMKSVQSTQQITRTMKMISASKFRKAQARMQSARPYAEKMAEVLHRVGGASGDVHSLLQAREIKKRALVVITSDRGLAGGYNANISRLALAEWRKSAHHLITVGRKGRDFLRFRGIVPDVHLPSGEEADFAQAQEIATTVSQWFLSGEADEIILVYTRFISTMSQKPETLRLLPLSSPQPDEKARTGNYLFEPSAEEVLGQLLPAYLETVIYQALLEAKASEHGARMTAMEAATKNAEEMVRGLTLSYNRARQAAITREIAEIVGGAEALK